MKWFAKFVPKLKASQGSDWLTQMQSSLTFVFDYFRNARNDAGHPTGTAFSKELVQSHLVVFRSYVRLIYELMEWMNANKPL